MKLQNLIHIVIGIGCIGLLPRTQAVVPPPDGGYPGFTTAQGTSALQSLTTGAANTAVGWHSLFSNAEGSFNTATGAGALLFNTADANTAFGAAALLFNATGGHNTAIGAAALLNNTNGVKNTATGAFALNSNTTGNFNTATGDDALVANTGGWYNTASGWRALYSNTTGQFNTANGAEALFANQTGNSNTAIGVTALSQNTIGYGNTATGDSALHDNIYGFENTATGTNALHHNTSGYNTAIGTRALVSNTTGSQNTAIGVNALQFNTTGHNNTVLGAFTGGAITGGGNVCIGMGVSGEAGVDDRTYIRNVNTLTQNFSAAVNNYVTVRMSDGRLGNTAVVSSRRYKEEIKPLAATSEAIYALEPVSFRLKKEYDDTQQLGFGLIAEEVERVNPDLVYRNNNGRVESVRYEMVNAMLLNEFLKEHQKVQALEKQVEKLTAGLQKVSDQLAAASPSGSGLEAGKPATQVVNNP